MLPTFALAGIRFARIIAENIPELDSRLKKLNRKLETAEKKSGQVLGRVAYRVVGPAPELRVCMNPEQDVETLRIYRRWPTVYIGLSIPELKLGPWEVKGVIESLPPALVLIHGDVPDGFRSRAGLCEHCNRKRTRSKTVIVRNSETGDIKAVGTRCLSEFMGLNFGLGAVEVSNFLATLSADVRGFGDENEFFQGGRHQSVFTLSEVLNLTLAVIRNCGYLSKSKVVPGGRPATSFIVEGILTGGTDQDEMLAAAGLTKEYLQNHPDALNNTAQVNQIIEELGEHLEKLSAPTNYEDNLKAIIRGGYVPRKAIGYAVSIPGALDRKREREAYLKLSELRKQNQAEIAAKSQFAGDIGKRQTFDVLVTKRFHVDNDFGGSTRYLLSCGDNQLGWWYSGSGVDLEVGKHYQIKGTIKKLVDHPTFGKTTELSRVTLIKELPETPAAA